VSIAILDTALPVARDPADVEVYALDYTEWLGADTLASVTLGTTGTLVAVVVTLASNYLFKVSGGLANWRNTVTLTATSSSGRVRKRSLTFDTAAR